MCESCQKGRLQVGKLGCCMLYFQKMAAIYLFFLCFHEKRIWIWNFTIWPLYNYKSCLISILLSSKKFDCFKSSWKHSFHNSENLAAVRSKHGFSSYFKDLKYLLNVDLQMFILSSQKTYNLQIFTLMIKLKKKCLYLLLNCIEFNWPNAKIPNNS
jgi:hypothetical protein